MTIKQAREDPALRATMRSWLWIKELVGFLFGVAWLLWGTL